MNTIGVPDAAGSATAAARRLGADAVSADADARVKTLVLSHVVPAEDPVVRDQTWIDAARRHFAGRIIVGKDLLEI